MVVPHRVELVLHVLAVQLPADRPPLLVQLLVERHQADLQGDVVVLGESNCPPDTVPIPVYGTRLGIQHYKGGIPKVAPLRLASLILSLPPIHFDIKYARIPVHVSAGMNEGRINLDFRF